MSDSGVPTALAELLANARVKHFPKKQILLYEGDSPDEVFIIKEGIIKLHNIDHQGNEKILHLLGPSNIMPLAFFSRAGTTTRWYYSALTDCDVYVLERAALHQLMEEDTSTMNYLVNHFSEEVHEVLVRLDSLSKSDVYMKITSALSYLVADHCEQGRGGWWKVPFPVNHQLLADMIGVSRETTSIAMKTLTDKKIVRNPRLAWLEINSDKLKEFRQELLSVGNGT